MQEWLQNPSNNTKTTATLLRPFLTWIVGKQFLFNIGSVPSDKGFDVDDKVCAVVRRRLAKQRGRDGFANARAVRTMFERAEEPARERWSRAYEQYEFRNQPKPELEIITTDVIGERPNRHTTHPEVQLLLRAQACGLIQVICRLTEF